MLGEGDGWRFFVDDDAAENPHAATGDNASRVDAEKQPG